MAQLICQDLCIGYDGKQILQPLNFSVYQGDYLCIVGENGSGKSTLMKTLLGLHSPISGKILMEDGLKKTEIGYLPQQTIVQKDFPASVKEIVLSGCQGRCGIRPFYSKEEKILHCYLWKKCRSLPSRIVATENYPVDSNRGFSWLVRCVQPEKYFFLMNLFQVLIQK